MSKPKEKLTKAILTTDGRVLTQRPDGTYEQAESKTDWARLASMNEEEADYSDIPELTEAFWEKANVVMPENKQPVFMRLDSDVLRWFKEQGRGYQTRINAVLRAYMKTHTHPAP